MMKSNIQCTLDVESSTSFDLDTSLDDSSFETKQNNSIEELVDEFDDKDDKKIEDVSSLIIQTQCKTQLAVVMPSPSPRKVKAVNDLHKLAVSIKNCAGSSLSKSNLAWASK